MIDSLLEELAIAIVTSLREGTAEDGLYIDSLAQMIAAHLARHHSVRSKPARIPSPQNIASWKVRRLLEYIEQHLSGDLTLEAMASEVSVSPLYLARAFKAAVGRSPHQYVLQRRIERAKELLRGSDTPIVEVALAAGFSSQSHLSNWFLRQVGVSPAAYRRHGA
jgi:AraC family transcriptional regulator